MLAALAVGISLLATLPGVLSENLRSEKAESLPTTLAAKRSFIAASAVHPVTRLPNNTITAHKLLLNDATDVAQIKKTDSEKTFIFEAMGQVFNLTLTPSRFNAYAKLAGQPQHVLPVYYEGKIEGDAQSWVRVAFENDQPSGHLFYFGELYKLDSRNNLTTASTSSNSSDDLVLIHAMGNGGAARLLNALDARVDQLQYAPPYEFSNNAPFNPLAAGSIESQERQTSEAVVTRAMRVGIVVDSRFNDFHNGRGLAHALAIMNSVDAIYQSQLGIAIIIEGVRVYENAETDPMYEHGGTVDEILTKFRSLRLEDSRLPKDLTLVHLFSGHRDPERVIGLGWISTACRLDGYDISVSTPFPFDTLLAAHEIAHNLGALHDDDPLCEIDSDDRRTTLMWPELSGNSSTELSACSIRNMQASKNAACNLENIDMSIMLRTLRSSELMQRSVIIEVANKDRFQRATEATSSTRFPNGTEFSDVSAGCWVQGTTVNCDHGLIPAQSIHRLSVSATIASTEQQSVFSEVDLLNAADIYGLDNRAVIEILDVDESSVDTLAATQFIAGDALANNNDTIGGFGRLSWLELLLFGLFALLSYRPVRRSV